MILFTAWRALVPCVDVLRVFSLRDFSSNAWGILPWRDASPWCLLLKIEVGRATGGENYLWTCTLGGAGGVLGGPFCPTEAQSAKTELLSLLNMHSNEMIFNQITSYFVIWTPSEPCWITFCARNFALLYGLPRGSNGRHQLIVRTG